MRRTAGAVGAALAAAVLVLSGCSPDAAPKAGGSGVDVDTPALRTAKAETRIPDCAAGSAEPATDGLPAITLPCLGGGADVDLSTLRGPMIVNLWASWCGPCRRELPIYQKFFEDHGDEVSVLGVDWQDVQPGAALDLAATSGVTYPLLADPDDSLSGQGAIPRIGGLPFLAVVDADGTVVHREFVEITSEQQLVDLVNDALGTDL
ncbi:TlpA family protein disulfide reductase [Nocardioides sp. KIGAM211]|uniref:TlpA family protein disulfide reductase n=1 Tax=Nocardioides luti TaxID=2761101 RepID=A0A7X0VAS3_9ACTN|nr:TlpA family protein disulfide reductase [Nocardioides luti]